MENPALYIHLHRGWNYNFTVEDWGDKEVFTTKDLYCHCCNAELDTVYSFIINSLKGAGLLHESYKPVCCYCVILKRYGLLEIKHMLDGIYHYEGVDVLKIAFSEVELIDGKRERVHFNIRICDWSKIKWES